MFNSLLNRIVGIIELLTISNPVLMEFIVKHTHPSLLHYFSEVKVLHVFNKAKKLSPAYRNFLKTNDVLHLKINSYKDFVQKIPETNKENYILKYQIIDRCYGGDMPVSGNIDESAGSSGIATMWIRSTKEEKKLHKLIDFALHYTFKSFNKNNLVVLNCWSTGPWATGVKFSQLAQNSTIVKCIGTDKKNAIETIKYLGKNCEYLICGYPPFVKEILDYGDKVNLDWSLYRVSIVTGGEGFSEGWRNFIRKKIKGANGEIYSAYGASDLDIGVGFETDLTIKIKQIADQDIEFRKEVFGSEKMPTFFGIYNPLIYHMQNNEKTGEILFTIANEDVCSPKIKYNLKDSGHAYRYQEIKNAIQKTKYRTKIIFKNQLKLPFFVIYGRSDGTISLDGANIYPNDIQDALFKTDFAKKINSFFIDVGYLKDKSMVFKVYIELVEGEKLSSYNEEDIFHIQVTLREELLKANKDYKESWENNRDSLEPRVELFEYEKGLFYMNINRIKKLYYKK